MFSSRPFHLPTDGRMGTKTPGRENAIHHGAMTVHGKGKHTSMAVAQPNSVQPQRASKDAFPSKKPVRLETRPLVDKTPFPNRDAPHKFNTPLPGEQKIAKLVLLDTNRPNLLHPNDTPDSVARPSSTRKHVRVPRSASKNFETPLTNGNHWDVSELEIVVPAVEELEAPVAVESDDYDEIEYMPPNTLETPYTPPFDFDLPNYAAVGAGLLHLAHSYPYDDAPPPEIEPTLDAHSWDMPVFALADIESDDPFLAPQVRTSRLPSRATASRPGTVATVSRPGTVASRQATARLASKPLAAALSRKPLGGAPSSKPPMTAAAKRPLVSAAPSNLLVSRKPLAPAASKNPPVSAASRNPPVRKPAATSSSRVSAASRKPLSSAASRAPTATPASIVAFVRPDPPAEEDFVFDI
ncbi:hypothetical protein DFH09DRAFT_1187181 [Mycena vulgaris]|nr:hypothetical protein DFH09DRAFT_1187181 [Mycena vulgaris]